MTLFKTVAQMPYFLQLESKYNTNGEKCIHLICFGVTYKKILWGYWQNRIRLFKKKKLRYHIRRLHTTKIHTLFNALGLKRHFVQDAQ